MYQEKPRKQVEYEYIPDDDYEEDEEDYERGGSRIKREARKKAKQSAARARADGKVGTGKRERSGPSCIKEFTKR